MIHSPTIHYSREIAPGTHNATRIAPQAMQGGPQYFKPELRRGIKERQETSARQRQRDKQREWADWERQVAEEEELRRREAMQRSQRSRQAQLTPRYIPRTAEEYADRYQPFAQAPQAPYEEQERIKRPPPRRLQRPQADQWTPPSLSDFAAITAAQEAKARAAAADSAVTTAFLQGQVRRKASRFADLVESMKESQASRDPFRNRREDQTVDTRKNNTTTNRRSRSVRRSKDNNNVQQWTGRGGREEILGPQEAEVEVVGMSYLPPDVVRVSREVASPLLSALPSRSVYKEREEEQMWEDIEEQGGTYELAKDRTIEVGVTTGRRDGVLAGEGNREESWSRAEVEEVEHGDDEYMDW